jgi:flagellar hook-associated protein 2
MASSSIFSGSSRFATDFTQVIERSVALASLPVTQLGSQRTRLSDQASALGTLGQAVSSLRGAVKAVDEARSALSVSSSDGMSVAASAELTALPGTYAIDVVSTGSRTTAFSDESLPKITDYLTQNISTAASLTLHVDSAVFPIVPTPANLASLVTAINEQAAAGVQAVIVNMGTASNPDFRISLQSSRLGPVAIQLEENDADPQSLLTQPVQGTYASYRINGQPSGSPLTSDSASQISVAPGLKIDLLKAGSSEVVVKHDVNKLTGALSGLAAAYNGLMTKLDEGRGESSSPLAAQSIVGSITQSLRRLTAFSSPGAVSSLADLGFTFSDKGVLSFDSVKFGSLNSSDAFEFLGSLDENGLLASATDMLDMIESDSSGLLPTSIESLKAQLTETDRQIAANQERVELLKQRLASQMAAADALIGAMEQQVSYMNGLFEAMRINAES